MGMRRMGDVSGLTKRRLNPFATKKRASAIAVFGAYVPSATRILNLEPHNDSMIAFVEVPMAQIIVRQLDDDVKARLQRRADRHGRSMEAEVRDILRAAAKNDGRPSGGLGSRIADRFRGHGLESDLPEVRGQSPNPAEFHD